MYRYKAELIRVVDGDTVDLSVDLGFRTKQHVRVRLAGINAPEKRGSTYAAGKAAAERLEELLLAGDFTIETEKTGKFGRWLAEIYDDIGISINECLLDEGHAIPYGEKP